MIFKITKMVNEDKRVGELLLEIFQYPRRDKDGEEKVIRSKLITHHVTEYVAVLN